MASISSIALPASINANFAAEIQRLSNVSSLFRCLLDSIPNVLFTQLEFVGDCAAKKSFVTILLGMAEPVPDM
jgi:hypothetical protein